MKRWAHDTARSSIEMGPPNLLLRRALWLRIPGPPCKHAGTLGNNHDRVDLSKKYDYPYVVGRSDAPSRWLQDLVARRGYNRAAVASANKNARVIQALLSTDEPYRSPATI
jgi:hypothetical protein